MKINQEEVEVAMLHLLVDTWKAIVLKQIAVQSKKGHQKNSIRIKHEEDFSIKAEHFQKELGAATVQTKRERGSTQQNIPSKSSYQDK